MRADQFDSMDDAIASYHYVVDGLSQALSCTDNPDCPRHGRNTDADRERMAQQKDEFMVAMCQVLVELHWRQQVNA